ncbi:hypothetical protein HMPREF1078_03535 [Parabacteroides merdae CL09T00C40]|uniref:Uncharacterized protein n=1 Tax=Parabacteroides merdae TaxID=46503 RepID=A0A6N3E8R9_9BACT|nr:hypothetical protein HMPREF1078_03535 [Parabacteroides merdae CL09T00C40]QUT49935.1 hypothetical protein INE87_02424 [Parabacteroides merdae]CDD12371.1 unknown [Parabacteroides merdae CAG:48]CUP49432.1 Uncharacterised protein [Parabacteroides merdae]SUV32837.1 Uncharacterised protein [Parabacteroides merdae]
MTYIWLLKAVICFWSYNNILFCCDNDFSIYKVISSIQIISYIFFLSYKDNRIVD